MTVRLKSGTGGFIITGQGGALADAEAASSQGWITALDLDWSALSTTPLATDTTYSIGGVTWTKTNSGQDATAMTTTNGAGLVIIPKGANLTTYDGSRSLPCMWAPLSSFVSNINLNYSFRVWHYISAANQAAIYDNVVYGFDTNSTTMGIVCKRGYNTNGFAGFHDTMNASGANAAGFNSKNVTLDTTNNTVMCEMLGIGNGLWKMYYGAAYAAGAWPTYISMASKGDRYLSATNIFTPANIGLFIGAQRLNSATSFSATIARTRLDYLPG